MTKASLVVMGAGCFRFHQFAKGALYLASEILFFLFLGSFGPKYLSRFLTLGENAQLRVWNEELQIFQRIPGDNSMLILLFSVMTLAATVVFLWIWYCNLKSAGTLCQMHRQGKHIPSFREDCRTLLPNSKPIIANTAINAFIAPWVDFIFVSVIMKDNYNNYTVAKGLYTMVDKANIYEYYTAFCAGAVLVSIPIVILFVRLQKFYVAGVTSGAAKG